MTAVKFLLWLVLNAAAVACFLSGRPGLGWVYLSSASLTGVLLMFDDDDGDDEPEGGA